MKTLMLSIIVAIIIYSAVIAYKKKHLVKPLIRKATTPVIKVYRTFGFNRKFADYIRRTNGKQYIDEIHQSKPTLNHTHSIWKSLQASYVYKDEKIDVYGGTWKDKTFYGDCEDFAMEYIHFLTMATQTNNSNPRLVLGFYNRYDGTRFGHAWVEILIGDELYIADNGVFSKKEYCSEYEAFEKHSLGELRAKVKEILA